MKVEIIKCLQDNYTYLIINEKNNYACIVDPGDAEPVIDFIQKKNIKLKFILNTHHHFDHIGGNKELKKKYNSKVIGFKKDENICSYVPSNILPQPNENNVSPVNKIFSLKK